MNDTPAFPTRSADMDEGMTLRDYFAAKAMHGLVMHLQLGISPQDCISVARDAYMQADAMLEARKS